MVGGFEGGAPLFRREIPPFDFMALTAVSLAALTRSAGAGFTLTVALMIPFAVSVATAPVIIVTVTVMAMAALFTAAVVFELFSMMVTSAHVVSPLCP